MYLVNNRFYLKIIIDIKFYRSCAIESQAGNLGVTGLRTPNDQYNSMADLRDRQTAYTDVKSMADSYMADCLSYLKRKKSETGFVGCDTKKRRTNIIVVKS